jgi:hypothetical protein
MEQIKSMASVFEYTYLGSVGIFVFDRSSTYEGFAENALNINSMNILPRGKQRKLHNTIIPLKNLDPVPGEEDIHGWVQHMCFSDDYKDPGL